MQNFSIFWQVSCWLVLRSPSKPTYSHLQKGHFFRLHHFHSVVMNDFHKVLQTSLFVMYQSFATTPPRGQGNNRILNFRFAEPMYKPCTMGNFCRNPAKLTLLPGDLYRSMASSKNSISNISKIQNLVSLWDWSNNCIDN